MQTTRYQVRPDDTIVSIANRFRTTPEVIAQLNYQKGIVYSAVSRYDFKPGSLRVGELLVVPTTGAGDPGRRRQAPRRRPGVRPQGRRAQGLRDEDCGDGQHLVDFGDYVGCVSDNSGQPCGNGGTYNDYGECEGGGVVDYLQKLLGIGGGQAAYNAYQSGQDGKSYVESLSEAARQQVKALCGYLNEINVATGGATGVLVITGIPGAFLNFLTVACYTVNQFTQGDQPDQGDQPAEQYPKPCGAKPDDGFYILEPGGPCLFAGAGDTCQRVEPGGGFVFGTFNDQGACIPDADKTAANKPDWLCDAYQGAPGSTVWFDQQNNVWYCLAPCGPNETLDPSDGMCACNAGYKRDKVGTCVKSSGTVPGTGGGGPPAKTPPAKVPPKGIDDKPPVKPAGGKKEESNGLLYGGAAALVALAIYLGTRKKKG